MNKSNNYSEFMSGDNQRNDNSNNNNNNNNIENKDAIQEHAKNDIIVEHKSSFSVNAKPFVTKEQQIQSSTKPAVLTLQQQQPLLQLNAAAAASLLLQNLAGQQRQAQQAQNHVALNNLGNIVLNNLDKNRLISQAFQQPLFQPTNLNDLTLAAFACLPSSLQQFYLQLSCTLNQNAKNSQLVNDLVEQQTPTQLFVDKGPVVKTIDALQSRLNVHSDSGSTAADKEKTEIIFRNPKSKYPLEYEWSFWFFKTNRDVDWKDNIILLTTVDNVEDFWSVYRYLRPVSDLHEGCDYMFFKKGIQPMWEDEANRDGGRWLISFDRDKRYTYLDTFWKLTLLSLIGSQYDKEFELLNGAVVNVRYKIDKLSLWTRNYANEKAQLAIGKRFKRILGVNDGSIIYEIHDTNHQQSAQYLESMKQ